MKFSGQQTVNVPRDVVWAHLMDPQKVADCAPGFQGMEVLGPDHFKPTVGVGIGAVKATFTLDVHLVDLRQPEHAAMTAHGVAAGSGVDMRADMELVPEAASVTSMRWTAEVNVSGKIASMGSRLLESTANKLTGKFFDCLRQTLETSAAAGAPVVADMGAAPDAAGARASPAAGGAPATAPDAGAAPGAARAPAEAGESPPARGWMWWRRPRR